MDDHNGLWCSLTATYSGSWANCVGPCYRRPCENGGVCTETKNDSYSCECAVGYSGDNCEIVGPCAGKPCQNGGICTENGNNSRSCQCAVGYFGENCEKKLPCPPGKKTDDPQGACCVFPFTYGGTTYSACTMADHNRLWCITKATGSRSWANCVGPCDNNPCLNGGVCTATRNDSYTCKCASGYSGGNCEIELPCPPGKKTDDPQGACCVFPFTYGGTTYSACTMADHNRLWCITKATGSRSWANCVGPCDNNLCLNGGVCTATRNDSYNCKCISGYSGGNCEIAGPCAKKPCQNGGICTEIGNNSRSCQCAVGYSGENCEKKLPCPPGKKTDNPQGACCFLPFTYGGTTYNACTMAAHSRLWCSLTTTYSGSWANCAGPCAKKPCQNKGICTETGNNSHSCQCAVGYSGGNCEKVTVDGWRSEGCFKVLKKGEKIDFNERFADFKAIGEMKCDVKTAFELCKVAAEEKGYEMFGVLGVREMKTGRS
ncbi:unnamed protein product [Pocillopora meandrina]|uniref:Uncharacterized protein n=1 Tax=Pocillopora meandrina TaxID=46732 RepID=A0AAU9XGR4_9CNID|nr:unnamed protein product [Pocillopora meandrina]